MLILDKKEDVVTLRNLGADDRLISRIFLFEGRLILSFRCCIRNCIGLGSLPDTGEIRPYLFRWGRRYVLVDAYPVSVHFWMWY